MNMERSPQFLLPAYDVFLLGNYTSDVMTSKWPLMENGWPIFGIACCYLYFVLKLGVRIMENRKAYKLNQILVLYNLLMVACNAYICILSVITCLRYPLKHIICSKSPIRSEANAVSYAVNSVFWYYTMSKVMELLDTVFFVLRKKQSQISTLHVYHHTNMMIFTWLYVKYTAGEQSLPVVFVNALIHVLMYAYYTMAAMGVDMRRHLTLKKWMTKLQLFLLVIVYLVGLALSSSCEWSPGLIIAMTFNTATFLLLFLDFYRRSYLAGNSGAANTNRTVCANDNDRSSVEKSE